MNETLHDFLEIFETLRPKLTTYLAYLVGEAEAEDLVQEVYIKASRALSNFRGDSTLSTWLYSIATHTATDFRRSPAFQHQAQNRPDDHSFDDGAWTASLCDAFTGEKALPIESQHIKQEMSACILSRMEKLPDSYRTILVLSDMQELSNKDIAEILGVTLDTVKIRLHRARAMLREQILSSCEYYWVSELSWQAA